METKDGGVIAPSSERHEQTTSEYEAIAKKEQTNVELVSCVASGEKLAVAKSLATLGRRCEVNLTSHARALVRLVPTRSTLVGSVFICLSLTTSAVLRRTGAELVLTFRARGHREAACFPLEGKSPA